MDLSGAVGVTMRSKLAIADHACKGIQMFSSLGVPTLAMVENMSYFEVRQVQVEPILHLIVLPSCLRNLLFSVKAVECNFRLAKAFKIFWKKTMFGWT